jgi:hypothetical protein
MKEIYALSSASKKGCGKKLFCENKKMLLKSQEKIRFDER